MLVLKVAFVRNPVTATRQVMDKKAGPGSGAVALIDLNLWLFGPLELVYGRNIKDFGTLEPPLPQTL